MVQRMRRVNQIRAKNFIHEEAQARMFEVRAAVAEDYKNAIFVNGTPIWYFNKNYHGTGTCTCRKHAPAADIGNVRPASTSLSSLTKNTMEAHGANPHADGDDRLPKPSTLNLDTFGDTVALDFNTPLEWAHDETMNTDPDVDYRDNAQVEVAFPTADIDDLPGLLPETTDATGSEGADRVFGAAVACAVCQGTGVVNGYSLYGHDRKVLETSVVTSLCGYTVNSNAAPYEYVRENMGSDYDEYVEYTWFVPGIFHNLYYGVYAGSSILDSAIIQIDGDPFTLANVRAKAGREVRIRVSGVPVLTHAVMIAELSSAPLRGDFPQMSDPHDYGLFVTTGNQTIHIPDKIATPMDGDIVMKMTDKSLWRVGDKDYFTVADNVPIGWTLNGALVQPGQNSTLVVARLFSL